jgi:type IV secretion system protein VirB4
MNISEKLTKILISLIKKPKSDPISVVSKTAEEDFIPYVCNYSKNTILTKNGDLLQTIKIDNFKHNPYDSEIISIREALRDSIAEHIKDTKFGLYFHVIRRAKDISLKGEYKESFANLVNDAWIKENQLKSQLVNELYITIVIEGISNSITNFNAFWHSFSYMTIKSMNQNHLKNSYQKLSEITTKILVDLNEYGASLLGISEIDGVLYSDFAQFFGKILNLKDEQYKIYPNEIAIDLASHSIAFGDREIEVKDADSKNFAAILSLKEYHEFEIPILDKLLQLPMQFIITQSFDFNVTKKDLEFIEYQNYILQLSGDENLRQLSGVASLIESNHDNKTDFGNLQTTIMVINNNLTKLQKDVDQMLEDCESLGSILIREDIFLEHCFWSQLPANFQFLRRQKVMNIGNVAGFCNLNRYPIGKVSDNPKNQATTIFKTVLDTPYFFDFAARDSKKNLCHTAIIGPQKSGKTAIANFLLSQARKQNSQIFYFDHNKSSECFIRALWGQYLKLDLKFDSNKENQATNILKMNPLLLPKNDQNKQFLTSWFGYLVAFAKEPIAKEELDLIPEIIEKIYLDDIKDFSAACKCFNQDRTKNIYHRLKIWHDQGQLSHIFNHLEESDLSSFLVNGFDLSEIFEHKAISIPIIIYLLHKIEINLDGQTPTFIIIDNSWPVIDNKIFAPLLKDFLTRMQQKNCIVIFIIEDIKEVIFENVASQLKQNLATEIYLPNPQPNQYYQAVFNLNDEEMNIIQSMQISERHFLFKNDQDSIISYFKIDSLPEIIKILSADEVTLAAMNEVIAANFPN